MQAGLGGARDATNVICGSHLAASIITTIGEEHLDALGGSLESIAVAKSGIVKDGRPVRWFLLQKPFILIFFSHLYSSEQIASICLILLSLEMV